VFRTTRDHTDPDKIGEGKRIVEKLAKLKYEVQHDRVLSYLFFLFWFYFYFLLHLLFFYFFFFSPPPPPPPLIPGGDDADGIGRLRMMARRM